MNKLKLAISILFFASWCLSATVLASTDPECGDHVPLAELIANPDKYHGKEVLVVAHVTIEFENMTACPSENETQMKSCLWLDIDDGSYKTGQDYPRYEAMLQNWERFNHQAVAIRATFDKSEKGHFSMWPGGLKNIGEVSGHQEGWSFAANAAAPRTACAGELPAPIESSGWMRTGNLKLRNGDSAGAIADFSRAIALEPSNIGHYLIRAGAKEKKRDYTGAIADYSRAIEIAREDGDREILYSVRAEAKERSGDLDGAIADYSRAVEISPKYAGAYRSRGRVKQKQGDTGGAAADFARARQLAR